MSCTISRLRHLTKRTSGTLCVVLLLVIQMLGGSGVMPLKIILCVNRSTNGRPITLLGNIRRETNKRRNVNGSTVFWRRYRHCHGRGKRRGICSLPRLTFLLFVFFIYRNCLHFHLGLQRPSDATFGSVDSSGKIRPSTALGFTTLRTESSITVYKTTSNTCTLSAGYQSVGDLAVLFLCHAGIV